MKYEETSGAHAIMEAVRSAPPRSGYKPEKPGLLGHFLRMAQARNVEVPEMFHDEITRQLTAELAGNKSVLSNLKNEELMLVTVKHGDVSRLAAQFPEIVTAKRQSMLAHAVKNYSNPQAFLSDVQENIHTLSQASLGKYTSDTIVNVAFNNAKLAERDPARMDAAVLTGTLSSKRQHRDILAEQGTQLHGNASQQQGKPGFSERTTRAAYPTR